MKENALLFLLCLILPLEVYSSQTLLEMKENAIILPPKDSLSIDEKWSFKLKGFVQADLMFNTQKIGSKDGFLASTIVMPQVNNSNSYFSIRQSQLGVSARNLNKMFSAHLEIDLFGNNGTTTPRLRKAYITYGKWLIGQDWSNFSDLEIWPNIFDFAGANAIMGIRQMQLRYTTNITKESQLSLSLENPNASSITFPENSLKWKKKSSIPHFTTAYKYGKFRNYIRIAGILSPIDYERKIDAEDFYTSKTILGGGINLTGAVYLTQLNSLKLQTTYGTGMSTNNIALNNEGYDAVPCISEKGSLQALPFFSTSIAYEHWWNPKWSSVFFYSYVKIGKDRLVPNGMIKKFQNMSLNIVYQPFKNIRTGVETHYGTLHKYGVTKSAEAFRFQLSTTIHF